MKNSGIWAAAVLIAWTSLSINARADSQEIVILKIDNRASLTTVDIETLTGLVESTFKSLPSTQFKVVRLNPSGEIDSGTCDESCMVSSAASSGADFAVSTTVSLLGGRSLAALRLFDTKSGRLVSQELTEPQSEISLLAGPVCDAAKKLSDTLFSHGETAPPGQGQTPKEQPSAVSEYSKDGTLEISSDPSGASVYAGKQIRKRLIGVTPLVIDLAPNQYRLRISQKGYPSKRDTILILPGRTTSTHIDLFKSKYLLLVGQALIWPGASAIAAGAALIDGARYFAAGVTLAAVGGAFILTGVVLLITGAVRLHIDKKARRKKNGSDAPKTDTVRQKQSSVLQWDGSIRF